MKFQLDPIQSGEATRSCPTCQGLTFKSKEEPEASNSRVLTINIAQIRQESLKVAPCDTCSFLWESICAITDEETPHPDVLYEHIRFDPEEHGIQLGKGPLVGHLVLDPIAGGRKQSLEVQFYTTSEDPPSPWKTIGNGIHISPSGLSESCISLMRQWINSCTASQGKHINCKMPEVPVLPTRVIHVGDLNTPPRLYQAKAGEKSHYAALSHCWGGKVSITALTSNLEEYALGLPSPLPQTFRDAIAVAQALGLKYIWIDSLCIIQDSVEDWTAESSKMAEVYANAYVTISSDAANDSFAGFLQPPSRQVPRRKTIRYQSRNSNRNGATGGQAHDGERVIHVRCRGFLAEELPFHCWSSPAETSGRSRLSERAWVFQERLLSSRTIHFSEHEMAWECRSLCDCECSATSLRTVRTTSVIKHFLYPRQFEFSSFESSWRNDIVPAYSRLKLTVKSDRLPALEGLAQAAGSLRHGDRYIVGLWRKSLVLDMLWSTISSRSAKRLLDTLTPTWSWASVAGSIGYRLTELTEKDCKVAVENIIFDGAIPKTLVVNCVAVPVIVHQPWLESGSQAQPSFGPKHIRLAIYWDCRGCYRTEEESTEYTFLVFGSRYAGNDELCPFGILTTSSGNGGLVPPLLSRVGFIDGFRRAERLRRWDSSGWISSLDGESNSGSDGDGNRDSREQQREDWVQEVLTLTPSSVNIV